MFIQPTIDKLHALKLTGMADAVRKQLEDPGASQLSFEERLGLIVDHHWSWKENQALQRRLTNSKLRRDACIEDSDWQHVRGLDRGLVRSLATSDWVRKHHQLLLTGPTGVGKSFLASAFAQRACRDGFTAFYIRAAQLFRSLEVARADGSFGSLLHRLGQVDVLVVDDYVPNATGMRDLYVGDEAILKAGSSAPVSAHVFHLDPNAVYRYVGLI